MQAGISKKLVLMVFSLALVLFYNNCAEPGASSNSSASQGNSVPGLKPVNYFRSAPPANMTGESGYEFLLKEYFVPQCATCHDSSGAFSPRFADKTNKHDSYLAAKYYFDNADMVMRITTNPFCKPDCTLDPRGDVYKAIMNWLEHRD